MGFFKDLFTVYTTTRLIRVRSPFIAVLNTVLFIVVFGSFLGSIHLDIRKVYQKPCPVRGAILSKVKGFASTEHLTDEDIAVQNAKLYRRSWDAADIVYPAHGGEGSTGSFTIVTNLIITPNQTLSICPEVVSPDTKCNRDSDCEKGFWSHDTQGVFTGKCIDETGTCQIKGWCPVESDILPRKEKKPLLEGVENFTVFLKNSVDFPDCGNYPGRNVPDYLRDLGDCLYHPVSNPNCPIFKIGDIVKWSGEDNFTSIAIKGGVVNIVVRWDCDFDFGRTAEDCKPTYEFSRADKQADGWNFRAADFYADDQRTLKKEFGLKIIISLQGEGHKFTFYLLGITMGATIGFFSVVPLACDLLLDVFNKICKSRGNNQLPIHDGSVSRYDEESADGTNFSVGARRSAAPKRVKKKRSASSVSTDRSNLEWVDL